jgi:hypothetical protein
VKTRQEKLAHYATAKRITTGVIHQVVDDSLERFYVGKLRGNIVGSATKYRFKTKEDAYQCAYDFRESCREELAQHNDKKIGRVA